MYVHIHILTQCNVLLHTLNYTLQHTLQHSTTTHGCLLFNRHSAHVYVLTHCNTHCNAHCNFIQAPCSQRWSCACIHINKHLNTRCNAHINTLQLHTGALFSTVILRTYMYQHAATHTATRTATTHIRLVLNGDPAHMYVSKHCNTPCSTHCSTHCNAHCNAHSNAHCNAHCDYTRAPCSQRWSLAYIYINTL